METKIDKLIPDDAYLYFPQGEQESEKKNSSNVRLIFEGNTKFDDEELKVIEQFKSFVGKQSYELKSIWVDHMILRFLQANGFKMDKTLNSIKEHTDWRERMISPSLTTRIQKFLEKGYIYIHGRDHKFRPIIIFKAFLIDIKKFDVDLMIEALTFLLEFIVQKLLLPGQVENWIFITDLNGMGLTSIPLNPIKKVIGFLQHNYRGRLYVMYIVNTPPTIYIPWQMAKKFIEENTVNKIQFIKKQVPEPLFMHTNREQVEEIYGGRASNVTAFWPPVFPSDNYFVSKEEAESLIKLDQYAALYHDGLLAKHKVNMELVFPNLCTMIDSHEEEGLNQIYDSKEKHSNALNLKLSQPNQNNLHDLTAKCLNQNLGAESGCLETQGGDYQDIMDEDEIISAKQLGYIREFECYFWQTMPTYKKNIQ